MTRRCVVWGAICCTLLGVLPMTAAAQQSAAAKPPRHNSSRSSPQYVAVIGEVAVGGVHEVPSEHLLLEDLVQQAGGFTSRATGGVRIIRNGRAVLDTQAATKQRIPLQPGDVVVATANGPQVPGRTNGSPATESLVEIAIVNLIDRPVVLNLRPRHASLPTLLQLLRQHPNVARFVQVVGGGQSPRLRHGSVLVFDRRVVDPNRIPTLPGPIAATAGRSESNVRPVSSAASTQARPPIRQVQGTDENVPRPPDSDPRTLTTAPPPRYGSLIGGNAGPSLHPPAGLRTAAKPADVSSPGLQMKLPLPPDEPAGSADRDLVRKAERRDFAANDSDASVDWVTLAIAVFAVLGVLSATGLLISMARRAIQGQKRADETPARRRSRLDLLLQKELEIVVEPTAIPPGQSFFGRAAGPRRNRIDEEHAAGESQRPHIDPRVRTRPAEPPKSIRPQRGTTIRRTDGPVRPASASGEQRPGRTANPATSTPMLAEEDLG